MDNGRPEYEKTDENIKTVEALAIAGVPQKIISQILKISEPTLRKHFRNELDTSKARANAVISQALFRNAKSGNVAAQIFWLKTQAGWRETNHYELTGKDGEKLFEEPKQLIEIRRIFDEVEFSEPKNITESTKLVQNSEEKPKNAEG
tara:strand:+ start:1041 stop:1484 length:444 start_codon:yes stop_codon:yes gene_type:complete